MQTIPIPIPVRAPIPSARSAGDDLLVHTYDELEALYRSAPVPATLRALDGALAGRMLAWRRIDRGPLARALRRVARSPAFVWEGKTFAAHDDRTGTGHNRIQLRGVLGRQPLFPFTTSFAASLLDGRPTVAIDYDRPANPWWMRRIHDEVREVEPGLFLGLDLWRTRRRSIGLVWFSLAVLQ